MCATEHNLQQARPHPCESASVRQYRTATGVLAGADTLGAGRGGGGAPGRGGGGGGGARHTQVPGGAGLPLGKETLWPRRATWTASSVPANSVPSSKQQETEKKSHSSFERQRQEEGS